MTTEQILILVLCCAVTIITIIFSVAIVELQLRIDRLTEQMNRFAEQINERGKKND